MYHPTSRVLAVLELLQSRPDISGPDLAARLEVDVRTVRRYITILQDVGIPVEANIGRHGGYRLRPGFKLPPLIFTEEEATAIMLGLLGTSWLEIGQSAVAIEGALAKVSRVLPMRARERVQHISNNLFFFAPGQEERPDISLLIGLSEAIGQHHKITLTYRSLDNKSTQRKVAPYGIVGWEGRWYLVGYCYLREDFRTFRLDRMADVQMLAETFEREDNFDCRAYMAQQYSPTQGKYHIQVEFYASLYTVQQRISSYYGSFSKTPAGILFDYHYDDLESQARFLMGANIPFVVRQPVELRQALRDLAAQMMRIADMEPTANLHETQEIGE